MKRCFDCQLPAAGQFLRKVLFAQSYASTRRPGNQALPRSAFIRNAVAVR